MTGAILSASLLPVISKVNIDEFIRLCRETTLLDVRSPAEYNHAHIPGAISFPLFNDEERKLIGTAYKQESREKAIRIGLEIFGRNMVRMVEEAENISKRQNGNREFTLHCWRGGMRSAAVAWLLDLYGFKVYLLNGGYKAYRKWVLHQFTLPRKLLVIGGYTGSNKTMVLSELAKKKEKVIDLEAIAKHKGSAFGNLEQDDQPSQEFFENLLAGELYDLSLLPGNGPVWIEGESQRIGNVNIPVDFFAIMRDAMLLFLDIPFAERLALIVNDYGKYNKDKLINAIVRIKKRLGGLETKNAINALLDDDVSTCFEYLLKYYDKLYLKSTLNNGEKKRKITYVQAENTDPKSNLKKLMQHVE